MPRTSTPPGMTFERFMHGFRRRFNADANNYILQARSWVRAGTRMSDDEHLSDAGAERRQELLYGVNRPAMRLPPTEQQTEDTCDVEHRRRRGRS